MKKTALALLFCFCFSAAAMALSDFSTLSIDWDHYYLKFNIKGYPIYNEAFGRYDFFDLDDCYCGSLVFNTLKDAWEYLGL